MSALKPCPFCGAERAIELWNNFDAGHVAYIHCEGCGADGPSIYGEHGADVATQRARWAWNGRSVRETPNVRANLDPTA